MIKKKDFLRGQKIYGIKYYFNRFFLPLKFIEKINNYEITLDEAINYQTELKILTKKTK